MKIFINKKDIVAFVKDKLKNTFAIDSIEEISRLPKSISYVTWSFGPEAENHYRYKVLTPDRQEIFCQVTTFFGIWIIKNRFYRKRNDSFEKIEL